MLLTLPTYTTSYQHEEPTSSLKIFEGHLALDAIDNQEFAMNTIVQSPVVSDTY